MILRLSVGALDITLNTVLQSMVSSPFRIAASTIDSALEGVPTGKLPTYTTSLLEAVVLVSATLATSAPRAVSLAAAAVDEVPIAM